MWRETSLRTRRGSLLGARGCGVPVQAFYQGGTQRVGSWLNLLLRRWSASPHSRPRPAFLAPPLGTRHPERTVAGARKAHPKGAAGWEGMELEDMSPLVWPEEDTRAGWVGSMDCSRRLRIQSGRCARGRVRWPPPPRCEDALGSASRATEETISCRRSSRRWRRSCA